MDYHEHKAFRSTAGDEGDSAARCEPELDPPFEVLEPTVPGSPVVFSSPHSGSIYPASFLKAAQLDPLTLRRSEDAYVDELFLAAPALGAPLVRARFPRAYLDVNREPYELDPRMFDGRLPPFANTRSMRVAGGLGTIARVVGEAKEIYAGRLSVDEAFHRIETLYRPFHQALADVLQSAWNRHGLAVLVDCHSMPSNYGRTDRIKADIVLGDRYGTSCDSALIGAAESELRRLGYVVARNKPYAGGFITEHYGNPASGFHALQIEINRSIYMDEATLERSEGFGALRQDLQGMMSSLIEVAGRSQGLSLAAE